MIKTCNSCIFAINGKKNCALLNNITINPNEHVCPLHQSTAENCPMCGQVILQGTGFFIPEFKKYVCANCGPQAYTCATCRHRQTAPQCLIDKYNGPLDVIITVTKKQGFFQMKSQQVNPEVIKQICPNCVCSSPFNCQRFKTCEKWEANI